jgi:hypothetical protein
VSNYCEKEHTNNDTVVYKEPFTEHSALACPDSNPAWERCTNKSIVEILEGLLIAYYMHYILAKVMRQLKWGTFDYLLHALYSSQGDEAVKVGNI